MVARGDYSPGETRASAYAYFAHWPQLRGQRHHVDPCILGGKCLLLIVSKLSVYSKVKRLVEERT